MKSIEHAKHSVKQFGGKPEDYIKIHEWFDQFRFAVKEPYHNIFLHNTAGIVICEQVFGDTIINSNGGAVFVRDIAESHIVSAVGEMKTPQEWVDTILNENESSDALETMIEKAVDNAFDKEKDWKREYENITQKKEPQITMDREAMHIIDMHRKFD